MRKLYLRKELNFNTKIHPSDSTSENTPANQFYEDTNCETFLVLIKIRFEKGFSKLVIGNLNIFFPQLSAILAGICHLSA